MFIASRPNLMKCHVSIHAGGLAGELASLPLLDREALAEKWQSLYGRQPPARIGSGFLIRAIAYRMQERTLGGIKPATKRFLEKAAKDNTAGPPTSATNAKLGTRLLREWHGVTYEVLITEDGVQYGGKAYRSLSEVARVITGAKWSGPLFFGLKKKREAA